MGVRSGDKEGDEAAISPRTSVGEERAGRPTASPPFDPRQLDEESVRAGTHTTFPPSSEVTQLEADFVMPERVFFDRLEERARRAELLTALLQAQGLTPDAGVRALQAALGAIVTSAEETHLQSLASLARALQTAIGHLGITHDIKRDGRCLDVLVLDEGEISRDLVALAVEAQGHMVRCASSYDELVRHIDERLPDLIVTEIELSKVPARHFCTSLVELLATRPIPFVFFSSTAPEMLADLASKSRARAAIHKDKGIAALMAELGRVFDAL